MFLDYPEGVKQLRSLWNPSRVLSYWNEPSPRALPWAVEWTPFQGSFSIVLIVFLVFSVGSAYATVDPAALYRKSPLEFHRRLREDFTHKRDVRTRIQAVEAATGDRSFRSLLLYSDGKRQALRVQAEALRGWEGKRYDRAVALYKHAAKTLLQEAAASEAAFVFYYIAEILAERENFEASLQWLNRAAELIQGRNCFYLDALLYQSRAYSLWFLDELDLSAQSFSLALELWQKIDYPSGIIVSWSNLAALYQELRMWKRADHCYGQALGGVNDSTDEEIRFFLHANYAFFLSRATGANGNAENAPPLADLRSARREARRHLEKARPLRHVSPEDFVIVDAEVTGSPDAFRQLQRLQARTPSHRIQRARALSRYFQERGDKSQALRFLNAALSESERCHLRALERQTALELGQWLESQGEFERAAQLYLNIYNRAQNLHRPELAFPYTLRISPLFDGWIRCLIRLGEPEKAWRAIQKLTWLRKTRAAALSQNAAGRTLARLDINTLSDELDQFALVGRLENELFGPSRRQALDPATSPEVQTWANPERSFARFTTLEFWPDGPAIYAWINSPAGRNFREINLPMEITWAIRELLEPLYAARDSLPPKPSMPDLQRLYSALFRPVIPFFTSRDILIIAHKELQNLPFEMLLDENGDYLLNQYNFSYLPALCYLDSGPRTMKPYAPILISPNPIPGLEQAEREKWLLRNLFDDLKVLKGFGDTPALHARWVHVSTHFRLDERFWWASGFSSGAAEINPFSLLAKPWSCSLLSLAVCDAGNAYLSHSSYWLGLSELFLSRGVESLLTSRWRMDEASARICTDFFALCRQGLSMDQALTEARRRFLRRFIHRHGAKVRGDHPLFWAGITYVGPPGKTLYDPPQPAPILGLCFLSLLSLAAVAALLAFMRARSR